MSDNSLSDDSESSAAEVEKPKVVAEAQKPKVIEKSESSSSEDEKPKAKKAKKRKKSRSSSEEEKKPPPKKEKILKKEKKMRVVQEDSSDSEADSNGLEPGAFWIEKSKMKRIQARKFKGRVLIDIREMYEGNKGLAPGRKGISLSVTEWQKLTRLVGKVDEEILKMT